MTEEEKKRLLQMAKNASKQNPSQAFNRVQSQLQQKAAEQKKQQAAAQKASSTQKSSNPVNTIRKDTTVRKASASSSPSGSQQQSNGIRFAAEMPGTGLGTLDKLGGTGVSASKSAVKTPTAAQQDASNLQKNQILWHTTKDPVRRAQLNAENNTIRQRMGLSYDPRTGVTYDPETGRNYSAPTQAVFGGTPVDRLRMANQWRQSREFFGMDENDKTALPSMAQIMQAGNARTAWGTNAHQVMADLFNRSAEEWTEEDTRNRDAAVQALENEMSDILSRYGLHYRRGLLDTGGWSTETATDQTALDMLEQAGADKITRLYVQENINQRQAADRLGQGFEAVAKRAIGSIPALFETGQQQAENVEQSRQNPEFVQLEQEERQLESQLTSIPSTNYDGSLNQDYLEIYNQLQSVRERKNQLAVQTPVDQSKWGQTMLREAAEAQANATAGLATVPRFLANTGISIAGNAPGMATSLIPGVGPAVGATLMGAQAAGQRAQELSAEGAAPSEALGRGIVSGIIEAVTEKLPIDTLADILNRGGTDAVRSILRQMGIEAGEESASYMMNLASDWAAADPNAQFSFADLAEQALGGAISGGVYGGAGTLIGRTGAQTAQETAAAPRVENYSPVMQGAVQAIPEGVRQESPQAVQQTAEQNGINNQERYNIRTQPAGNGTFWAVDSDIMDVSGKIPDNGEPPFIMDLFYNIDGDATDRTQIPNEMLGRGIAENHVMSFVNFLRQNGYGRFAVKDLSEDGNRFFDRLVEKRLLNDAGYYRYEEDRLVPQRMFDVPSIAQQRLAEQTERYRAEAAKADSTIKQPQLRPEYETRPESTYRTEAEIAAEQADLERQLAQYSAEEMTQESKTQALGRRLAELDGERRAMQNILPGPARDARLQEIEMEIDDTWRELAAAQTAEHARSVPEAGTPVEGLTSTTAETSAPETEASVPVTEAIRYGATPQQAMREAEVRAQGEAVQEARENAREEMLNRITYEKSAEIDAQVRKAMERAERVASRHKLRRADTRATPSDADRYINHESENVAVDLVNSLESERFFLRTLRKAWKLTEAELVNAQEIASGRGPVTQMNDHRYELVETYARALRNYWNDMRPAHDFYDEMNAARTRRAEELIVDSDNWEDAKIGYQLSIRTPLRVLRKVMGDTEQMRAIYEAYFAPVIQHDAESVRWENNMRNRLKDIIKGLSHEDSVYIHLKNRLELNPKNETLQKLYADYVEKHQKKIHFAEADAAMEKLIEFTQDLHPQINEAWVRNGIDPLEFHRRYLPSITPTREGKWYNRILRGIGIETMADELPDEIAGRTENRRPGHQYASFAEERQGVNLEFDAIKAMDNYISNAATAIFHTDDIQNLRTLEETIRFKNADEGEQAELLAIMQNPSITIEDRVQQMSKIWEESQGNLPHFPSWIAEYTNLLAGKKARGDRQMESDLSRGMFRAMSDLEGKVAANMVGGNLSTALSNFIPLTQSAGELRYSSMARAMLDYTYDLLKKDSMFRDTSDFLTNRRGSDRIAKTRVQKASDLASIPVRAVDRMTSEVLTRARYIDNTKRGLNHQEALREADRWAAGLMGDRSKGAKPIVFDEKGPLKKAFTMFQLEVANQYDYLFGDIPANARAQGKGKAAVIATTAGALLQIFILSHLFNDAREKMTGTRSALDPIEIVNDFVGRATGYAMPNVFTMIQEAFAGDLGTEDFQVEASDSVWDNAKTTLQDVASNVPFLSGPVGALFGASNSRLPIQSVVPDIDSILSKSGAARTEAAIKELAKPIYGIVFPFGGTQAKKTAEGIATMLAGGSYVHDNDGNLKLQFPAYGESPLDWARTAVFGKWSSPEAQEYIDSGFKGLSADETSVYNYLRDTAGVEPRQAMDVITSLRGFESVKDSEGNTVQTVKDQQRLALFDNENLTPEQKAAVDRALIVSGEDEQPADYSDRNAFLLGQYVSESRRDAARSALETGLSIDQFVQWDDRLSELIGEKDENDKKVRTEAEARNIVLDEVMQDSALSDSEKQALADYVLISSIGEEDEKTRKNWETIAKGKVNATDYLRFKNDVSIYEKQAKGSGTDNMTNVAEILRGYDGLTDPERDVLFQTFNSTMKNNPFHISEYEQDVQDNQLYKDLSNEGKAALRALTNEYEQAISEGKELKDWLAKAYMADKEADIAPGVYAMYRVALQTINAQASSDDYYSQDEVKAAVNTIPGLTQYQKAYIWQSANKKWKKNPFGSATVGEYQSGVQQAINPVESGTQTSAFGPREAPTAGASTWHDGLDIAASEGEPVKAILSGKVVAKDYDYGGGYYVKIDHGDGRVSTYMHMQPGSTDGINVGDEIKQGQQIGAVGNTGEYSTGPHLDIRITKDGKYIDPLTVIPGYGIGPSGYVSGNTASSSAVASGVAAAQAAKSSGSSGSSKSSGLKSLDDLLKLDGLF